MQKRHIKMKIVLIWAANCVVYECQVAQNFLDYNMYMIILLWLYTWSLIILLIWIYTFFYCIIYVMSEFGIVYLILKLVFLIIDYQFDIKKLSYVSLYFDLIQAGFQQLLLSQAKEHAIDCKNSIYFYIFSIVSKVMMLCG